MHTRLPERSTQINAPRKALHGQDTTIAGSLYVAFELGDWSWKLSLGDVVRLPSRCTVAAGDTAAVFTAISKAKARRHLATEASVRSCYEAGRDGFWLHRCLEAHQITKLVVDSASIEVNRRRRRAKTDRLDSDKLLSRLMRYYAGERRVWAVARIPTPEQEDERRVHHEVDRSRKERTDVRPMWMGATCYARPACRQCAPLGGRSSRRRRSPVIPVLFLSERRTAPGIDCFQDTTVTMPKSFTTIPHVFLGP